MSDLSREEANEIAERAADRAVHNLFRALGVNVNEQEDLNALRADLIYSRRLRRLTESTSSRAWMVVVALVAAGMAFSFWAWVKDAVGIQ